MWSSSLGARQHSKYLTSINLVKATLKRTLGGRYYSSHFTDEEIGGTDGLSISDKVAHSAE